MAKEKHIKALERLLKGAPEIMSPRQASKWSPLGKNLVYELIHKGELQSYDPPVHPMGTGRKKK